MLKTCAFARFPTVSLHSAAAVAQSEDRPGIARVLLRI
jgi:hypothetical protein